MRSSWQLQGQGHWMLLICRCVWSWRKPTHTQGEHASSARKCPESRTVWRHSANHWATVLPAAENTSKFHTTHQYLRKHSNISDFGKGGTTPLVCDWIDSSLCLQFTVLSCFYCVVLSPLSYNNILAWIINWLWKHRRGERINNGIF